MAKSLTPRAHRSAGLDESSRSSRAQVASRALRAAAPEPTSPASPSERASRSDGRKRRSKAATIFLVLGITWLTAGVGMTGWVLWELYGTNIGVRDEYNREIAALEQEWASPAPTPTTDPQPGETPGQEAGGGGTKIPSGTFAILYIPRLNLKAPILAGIDNWSLARGVGWFPDTQQVGEIGNFAVAGHHSSHGQPFDNLQQLQVGDTVEVWVGDKAYIYRMITSPADLTVDYTETWVTLPDPINKQVEASRRLMTLVTCKEIFSTPNRSVGFAELQEVKPRS